VKEFRSVLPQVIMEMVEESGDVAEVDDLSAVLRKDAGLLSCLLMTCSHRLDMNG